MSFTSSNKGARASKVWLWLLVGASTGALISAFVAWLIVSNNSVSASTGDNESTDSQEKQPLYWVAPMDDSYRRNEPGKSPMGMDLVPVYEESSLSISGSRSPGTVMISATIQQNIGVKTAPVHVGKLNQTVTTVGVVSFDEDKIVHIHPRVEGWIETLHIKSQGEEVEAGQPLYTLYSPELVNAQEEYLLALKRSDKRLIEGALQRLKSLALPDAFLTQLQTSKQVSQTVTFSAPQGGVVEAMTIREGFFVQPGTTIMSIAKLEHVWIIADVPEKYVGSIQLGDTADVEMDYLPNAQWQGQIDYIYPSLSETTRTLKVRIPLSNRDGALKPNMFANVTLSSSKQETALLVPKSAVIRTAGGPRVVLSDGQGHFKSVNVKLGQQDTRFFAVSEGLLPGDEVVVSAQFLIDSESSKNSDFERMAEPDHQATTWGVIEQITASNESEDSVARMTISRGPIEKWGRGPATMSFALSEHIDSALFDVGDRITFTFVTGDEFVIVAMKHGANDSAMSKGVTDHNMSQDHKMDVHHD
ncbi:hemolysin D [Alteromonas sp. KUL42]|uniref:efflux RND transporter periplasmic adaptor subunit n=1 Tax=Alteromonas sp. KUL42 TaxID=2480797 RepID=UPI0010360510|nr:efflux RND transporter periplasmic adaptor subunit [Alteromonas sp. KUL42]TAP38189.1 efflux RND transporter periplasmic adaptor subunit [Alteromonas sp. KUL42]GEA05410.1 hemolysin D [Alteromonas sp. KUL42]